jgi:hypothetical protein
MGWKRTKQSPQLALNFGIGANSRNNSGYRKSTFLSFLLKLWPKNPSSRCNQQGWKFVVTGGPPPGGTTQPGSDEPVFCSDNAGDWPGPPGDAGPKSILPGRISWDVTLNANPQSKPSPIEAEKATRI